MDSTSTLETAEQRDSVTPAPDEVTTELSTPFAATSDRCPNCGARMAPDQRYCIECGERRTGGGLRDALPRTQTTTVAAAPPRRPRMSANSNLIAGIATLLIAMGVGVLIGRSGDHPIKSGNAPVQVVTVPAGGAAGTATTAAGSTATTPASATSKAKKSKGASNGGAQQTAAKAHVKLPPPVVKVGSKCAKGAKGCQKGKFTGSFFGQ